MSWRHEQEMCKTCSYFIFCENGIVKRSGPDSINFMCLMAKSYNPDYGKPEQEREQGKTPVENILKKHEKKPKKTS